MARADVMRNEPIPLPLANGPGPYGYQNALLRSVAFQSLTKQNWF
jgi:hypothetical protein